MNIKNQTGYLFYFYLSVIMFSLCLTIGCSTIANRCIGLPKFTHDYDRHKKVFVEMRDGIKLNTDVYFPKGEGPWPVVFIRSPYNMLRGVSLLAKMFTYYGYVGIHQDVRGSFNSEGEWYPFLHERDDGADTLAWLVKQSWQDGNIAMFGGSYFGYTQLIIADILPPEVKTIIPMIVSFIDRKISENGMFFTDVLMGWSALMYDGRGHVFNGRNFRRALKHFPPNEADVNYFGNRIDWFRELASGVDAASHLQQRELARISATIPENIDIPVLMVSGWYDLFTAPQIRDFQRLKSRDQSRIIVGPWTHLLGILGDGDKDFPDAGNIIDQMPRILNWLDHYLRGGALEDWGPFDIYAIGDDKWETYKTWPPETTAVRYYPDNAINANTCDGGNLVIRPSDKHEEINYVYDPRNPVPTKGGHSLLMFVIPGFGGKDPSSRNQKGLCRRDDVITFISEPLTDPLPIRGTIKVRLTVSSNAEDTAFTAKLIEVNPKGLALNISDGITRLAYRNGATKAVGYTPGQKIKLNFEMHPVAWTVKPGYRLRLDISSSNFPAYHAHANKAGVWCEQTEPIKATQTLFIGQSDAAYVELPILSFRK